MQSFARFSRSFYRQVKQIRQFSTFNSLVDRETIIPRVEHILNIQSKNYIAYHIVKPQWWRVFTLFGIKDTNQKKSKSSLFDKLNKHSSGNPYSHAGIEYSLDNKRVFMNISGGKNTPLVNFFDANEYLFTDKKSIGNQQEGIFNRSFYCIRLNNISEEKIRKLHEYYLDLAEKSKQNKVSYGLIFYIFTNKIKKYFGLTIRGNCAYWTGQGLEHIGLIRKTSNFPLYLLFKILLQYLNQSKLDNINIISYRSINHKNEPKGSLIYPFYWLRHSYRKIWNLDSFANIIVEPLKIEDEYYAVLKEQEHVKDKLIRLKKQLNKFVKL